MASTDARRPNVLVVLTDDQGPWAMGHRNPELVTPAIDGLVASGTELDRFFCASPVCSPARASLLTGRMPSAHGVHDWIRGEAYGVRDEDSYLAGLATTPEVLAAAGWECGHSGKWHLGTSREPAPGFEHWYAHRTGDGRYTGAPVWRDGRAAEEPRYLTEAITDEALDFLRGNAGSERPFYLQVNYTAPHSPWVGQHPARYTDVYDGCRFASCPREEPHPWFSWEPGPVSDAMEDPGPSLRGYFASLTAVDAGVRRLLDVLDGTGLRDSTCVVYTSDNGFSCGHHGIWGKGNATWPLNMWENSVRVPFVVSMPGRIPAGRVDAGLAGACDLHPTILDIAGVAAPEDPLAAGRSLLPRLRGDTACGDEAVVVFDEYGGTRMVRTQEWKYVVRHGDGPEELYHLVDDPDEREDRAGEPGRAAVRDELSGVLHDWFARHAAAARDAFARPVSGRGQMSPVWRGRPDAETYARAAGERRTVPGRSTGAPAPPGRSARPG
ncbi:sulfatase-like hydrolase/transferase [Pseudonocardia kunmingensis]|uniref:Arylsulfatase A-like enzyme n=1 Tax=Pseudonocardia kunmingensis TaxID=630975 RepID=A0A543D105_9PSEU|nr:sulfatase-like hydrolase/transferase [Pseudonocardia kunmingensis]TQM02888.1 arylsulfatase A-like enzyme [Pseudonocardia kunmingensis]